MFLTSSSLFSQAHPFTLKRIFQEKHAIRSQIQVHRIYSTTALSLAGSIVDLSPPAPCRHHKFYSFDKVVPATFHPDLQGLAQSIFSFDTQYDPDFP